MRLCDRNFPAFRFRKPENQWKCKKSRFIQLPSPLRRKYTSTWILLAVTTYTRANLALYPQVHRWNSGPYISVEALRIYPIEYQNMRLQRSFRIYVWDQVQSAHNSGICHSRNPTERLSESASDLDVWAFAVLFHFLLMSCHIFPSVQFRDHTDEVLRHMMVVLQRKLLERLW